MSDFFSPSVGTDTTALTAQAPAVSQVQPKGIDLATLKKGAKDFLDFADSTKEIFYAYLYHRTGSVALAKTLLTEIYMDALGRALSMWWFGNLNLTLLLDHAERALRDRKLTDSDLETVYVPSLVWLTEPERASVGTLHDALWSLPSQAQRLLILSLFVGLSDDRIAELTALPNDKVRADLVTAKDLLLTRWQPLPALAAKLQSLVFEPSLDLASETTLRFALVEKYNALRLRKYQWVIIGGLFAVMSNVIVASVLAFTVIVAPPTSLRGTRAQVATLDAVLLKREIELSDAKKAVHATFRESQRIAAYSVSRDLTSLGLASALEALKSQQEQEAKVNQLLKLLKRADTAFEMIIVKPMLMAMQAVYRML